MSFQSLSEFKNLLQSLPVSNKEAENKASERNALLTKPAGSLGRLEDIAIWMSAWQGANPPTLNAPQICIFAGNHGVCKKGVSAFPPEVTVQMVANFENDGAAINQLAKAFGASFSVHPIDLETPTADFTEQPALTEEECASALLVGWNAVNETSDCLVVGEMGIGNTTVAAALSTALFGGDGRSWAGAGTGMDDAGILRKADVIDAGINQHKEFLSDPLEVLRRLGGREIAAMTGAILSARMKNIPVVLDGFVVSAAAAILFKANPEALDHCISGHVSHEQGHRNLLKELEKSPLLELGMRLGEGSGAALALGIVKGAVATHSGMASFAEAGVSEQD